MAEKKLPRGLRNNEEWRDIPGYEGLYQVSSIGNVFSYLSGEHLKRIDWSPYHLFQRYWANMRSII